MSLGLTTNTPNPCLANINNMGHTNKVDGRVLFVKYEDMVSDLRPQLKRMVRHCDLGNTTFAQGEE